MVQILASGSVDARFSSLFLDEHVVEAIALQEVDVGIDGSIAPVEEQLRRGELGEGLVGIAVIHAVVLLLCTVEHGIVDHVSAFLAVFPTVVRIPEDLRCPHTVDGAPVLVWRLGCGSIAEVLHTLAVIEGNAGPVFQVLALQEVDAIVIPLAALAHAHLGGNHDVALAIVHAGDVGIAVPPSSGRLLS